MSTPDKLIENIAKTAIIDPTVPLLLHFILIQHKLRPFQLEPYLLMDPTMHFLHVVAHLSPPSSPTQILLVILSESHIQNIVFFRPSPLAFAVRPGSSPFWRHSIVFLLDVGVEGWVGEVFFSTAAVMVAAGLVFFGSTGEFLFGVVDLHVVVFYDLLRF